MKTINLLNYKYYTIRIRYWAFLQPLTAMGKILSIVREMTSICLKKVVKDDFTDALSCLEFTVQISQLFLSNTD